MEWNPETISNYCQELVDKYFDGEGIFNLDVVISKRMRRMHGCVEFYDGVPIEMRISSYVLEHATDEEIEDLIKHEFAHWYSWIVDGINHGHDALFGDICYQIGCSSDEPTHEIESLKNVKTKWEVICPECGDIYRYHRANKVTKFPQRYYCKECGSHDLYVVQNW